MILQGPELCSVWTRRTSRMARCMLQQLQAGRHRNDRYLHLLIMDRLCTVACAGRRKILQQCELSHNSTALRARCRSLAFASVYQQVMHDELLKSRFAQ